jgi:hypothetical protein
MLSFGPMKNTSPGPMKDTSPALSVACLAGVFGAIACAIGISPGDGRVRVTMVMRAALVLLAYSLAAGNLIRSASWRASRRSFALAFWGAGCAATHAVVFGFRYKPGVDSFGLTPLDAIGLLPLSAAIIQTGGFIARALTERFSAK